MERIFLTQACASSKVEINEEWALSPPQKKVTQ